ncbi:MAG TPA: GNAT family N-acetyltransferase [Rhizomicrobium sp.]|nr:GNAT family N-acetyltransferase [Rhizomicrobium sp.]
MDEAISLRRANESDAADIAALTREAYSRWIAILGREPLPMRVDYHDAVRRHRFDLLHAGDRLAALIETAPDGDSLLIVNVAVRPGMQGRGLGRKLLSLAEEIATEGGFSGVRLYTNALMTENIRLYETLGYRREREELRDVGTVVYMHKLLRPG